jgi:hypothetical protein
LRFAGRPFSDTVQGTVSRVASTGAKHGAEKAQIPNPNTQVKNEADNDEVLIPNDQARASPENGELPSPDDETNPGTAVGPSVSPSLGLLCVAFAGAILVATRRATSGASLGARSGPTSCACRSPEPGPDAHVVVHAAFRAGLKPQSLAIAPLDFRFSNTGRNSPQRHQRHEASVLSASLRCGALDLPGDSTPAIPHSRLCLLTAAFALGLVLASGAGQGGRNTEQKRAVVTLTAHKSGM